MNSSGAAPGFHHVAIRAVDFDATIKFYTEALAAQCTTNLRCPAGSTAPHSLTPATAAISKCSVKVPQCKQRGVGATLTRNPPKAHCCIFVCVSPMWKHRTLARLQQGQSHALHHE